MAVQFSTGLRDGLLGGDNFQTAFNLGFIHIYDGVEPSSADDDVSGNTLLAIISNGGGGTGITFDAPLGGVIAKAAVETWTGNFLANGTKSFYRLVGSADTGAASTTEPRVQGTINVTGADMNLSSLTAVLGNPQPIDTFYIGLAEVGI